MEILPILISLILLMYLAYRGWSVIVVSPLISVLAVILSGDQPILASYTQIFMKALGGFITNFFPVFVLGSIFGILMDKSGFAACIAGSVLKAFKGRFVIMAIVLACSILTYGGVSLFVVAFSVYPIANNMFHNSNLPKRLIPACIALGSFTFTMIALPGTPSIQNAIPMPYFGTDIYAAPLLGIISSLLMCSLGVGWINYRVKLAQQKGEGYGLHQYISDMNEKTKQPNFILSISPIILMLASNFAFNEFIIPSLDTAYLAQEKFGKIKIDAVKGIWSIVAAMSITCFYTLIIVRKKLISISENIKQAVSNSFLPIFNTASEVGYGAVISSLSGFAIIKSMLAMLSASPLAKIAISVNILAGITGSSSGGLSIALQTLGDSFAEMSTTYKINPEILHRLSTIASSGLDTLPHCGAVITLLAICGLKHKESYFDIFMVSVVFTVLTCALIVIYGSTIGF
ncbi:GntP family permease [Rickettsiales endosymbiont of Stachyamoeba lipophora]|uniref:GntP family permease n=1 Tax=Rickettsiales endosymbiont of Stachyamoeba lipophora TaxID=2486578 RepID=UPI000F651392|nr:GntP family permease [Rickettsiales endosymbiont of Stachyamoeba lipophora]AZL16173.1 GntP family permease [Rickettsiales endosymbiont of Stachyamoeba lipophora]